jgi:hypothetical protein
VVGFDLAAGSPTVVRARWPASAVPAAGTHACILAAALVGGDLPPTGRHVWEHNDLAQRNLTIVDVLAGERVRIPFEVGSMRRTQPAIVTLEVQRPRGYPELGAALVGPGARVLWAHREARPAGRPEPPALRTLAPAALRVGSVRLDLAANSTVMLGDDPPRPPAVEEPQAVLRGKRIILGPGRVAGLRSRLPARAALALGLELTAPGDAKPGDELLVHLVQRWDDGRAAGGIGVALRIGG